MTNAIFEWREAKTWGRRGPLRVKIKEEGFGGLLRTGARGRAFTVDYHVPILRRGKVQ